MKAKGSLTKQEAEIEVTKEEVDSFFDKIIPKFVKEGGGIITDNVRFWRWKNQIKIVKRAKEIIDENNFDKQLVPLKVLVPLLESSSLEEDSSIQSMWSNLLANAVAGTTQVTPNFIEILKELSPIEALLLNKIFDEEKTQNAENKTLQFSKQKICETWRLPSTEVDIMIQNLYRLGLCREPESFLLIISRRTRSVLRHNTSLEF